MEVYGEHNLEAFRRNVREEEEKKESKERTDFASKSK